MIATLVYGIEMTWLEIVRLGISFVFVVFMLFAGVAMWLNAANVRRLLRQGQEDKQARELAVQELLVTAATLAEKTSTALENSDKQRDALGEKIDKNTELTIEAARASAKAADVANGMNEKIADTNRRIVETLEKHNGGK